MKLIGFRKSDFLSKEGSKHYRLYRLSILSDYRGMVQVRPAIAFTLPTLS